MRRFEDLHETHRNTMITYERAIKYIGLSFFENSDSKIVITLKFIVYILSISFFALCMVYYIIFDRGTTAGLFISIGFIVVINQAWPKHYLFIWKLEKIADLIFAIDNLWPRDIAKYGEDIKKKVNQDLQRATVVFKVGYYNMLVGMLYVEITAFCATVYKNMVDPDAKFTFPFEFCYPAETDSVIVFLLFFAIHAAAFILFGLSVFMLFVCLVGTLVSNISLLFYIIQLDLERAVKVKVETSTASSFDRNLEQDRHYKEIIRIIKTHQEIIKICADLNNLFSFAVFVDIYCTAFIIAFSGTVAMTSKDHKERANNGVPLICRSYAMFLLTWPGQLLADASANVGTAAYNSLWYTSDLRTRKLIYIIIMRSQNPVYLSAFNYSNITMETFTKIISTAWSYVSLLSQVMDN